MLTREKCFDLLKEYNTPEHVVRHCLSVTEIALNVAKALNDTGFSYDLSLIERAGILHDIVRTQDDHAVKGAEIVKPYDSEVAEIIFHHMTHDYPDSLAMIKELDILSLADRSVREDVYVGYEARIREIIERFPGDKKAEARLNEKLAETRNLVTQIEDRVMRSIDDIATGGKIPVMRYISEVERPGRYIGGEINSVQKNLIDVDLRICFAFPDLYEIGMSYTGLQIIYGLLNELDGVYCERTFAPAADMQALMQDKGIPLFTLETHTDLKMMDMVGFTLQYEQSYTNVISMLKMADIPVKSSDRDDSFPLIIAGGPCTYNPEPLADAFDIIVIGDSEELLPELCDLLKKLKNDSELSKEDILKELSKIEGLYIPAFYKPVYKNSNSCISFSHFEKKYDFVPDVINKRVIKDLDNAYFPTKLIVPLITAVQERSVVEIFRGCGRGCRFCQAGFVYRPIRRRSKETIIKLISEQLDNTGYDEVSLMSLSTGDYPGIEELTLELMQSLNAKDVSLSIPSLRLDSISAETLSQIGEYKKSSLTFAPEAGTQRLRDVIRKNITENDIFSGIEKAISIGWDRVKLYFMIGLPTETMEDLDGIVKLADEIMYMARGLQPKGKRTFSLNISVSNFVPKPNTPFQWAPAESEENLVKKNYYLKEKIRRIKGANFQYHDTRTSFIEMQLAKGDRRTLDAVCEAVNLGCKFDSWREHFDYEKWIEAFNKAEIDLGTDKYTDINEPLPWDHIGTGTDREFLLSEYKKALSPVEEVHDDKEIENSPEDSEEGVTE